jgi:hypothetical protein
MYYAWSGAASANKLITLTATAPVLPAQWTVELCPDNGSDAPNCSYAFGGTQNTCSNSSTYNNQWVTTPSAGTTSTLDFCFKGKNGQPQFQKYWTIYTGPTGTFTAFARYDGWINAADNQASPATNRTHDELYAGFIPVGKSYSVVKNNCKGTLNPPASGVCPGGVIQYTLNYANIVAGGNLGTEGQVAAAFPVSIAGSLKLTDDGSASGSNWATFTTGLTEALGAGLSAGTQASCGIVASSCGDQTVGTACTYDAGHPSGVNATKFVCTIGGPGGQLYPAGFSGKTSSGSLVFAAKVK